MHHGLRTPLHTATVKKLKDQQLYNTILSTKISQERFPTNSNEWWALAYYLEWLPLLFLPLAVLFAMFCSNFTEWFDTNTSKHDMDTPDSIISSL